MENNFGTPYEKINNPNHINHDNINHYGIYENNCNKNPLISTFGNDFNNYQNFDRRIITSPPLHTSSLATNSTNNTPQFNTFTNNLGRNNISPITNQISSPTLLPVSSDPLTVPPLYGYNNITWYRVYNNVGMNIPYFTQERLNQMEEIKVFPKGATERKLTNNFTMVSDENITTVWVNGNCFSYLSNPKNIPGKFYYLTKNSQGLYQPTFDNSSGVPFTRLNTSTLLEFVNVMNSANNYNTEEFQASSSNSWKKFFSILLACLSLAALIFMITGLIDDHRRFEKFPFYIFLMFINFIIFIISSACFCSIHSHANVYLKLYNALNKNAYIEELLKKWNNEVFIPNGLYATTPKNNNYIEFATLGNRLTMINHNYPHDLDSIPNRNISYI